MLKCFIPNCKTHGTGAALFRINAKGQPGIWACREHVKRTDAKPAQEVVEIVDAIEGRHD